MAALDKDTTQLLAIVVTTIAIGGAAFVAKRFDVPELYGAVALLTFFLGRKTGHPSTDRVEATLRTMPSRELDRLLERVTGRPPSAATPPITFEGEDTDG